MLSKVPGGVPVLLRHGLSVASLVPLGDDQLHVRVYMCYIVSETCLYLYKYFVYMYRYMYCVYMYVYMHIACFMCTSTYALAQHWLSTPGQAPVIVVFKN